MVGIAPGCECRPPVVRRARAGADLQAGLVEGGTDESLVTQSMFWNTLLSRQKLEMDKIHTFEGAAIQDIGAVSHVRLNIHPDGGVSRFRVFGHLHRDDAAGGPVG